MKPQLFSVTVPSDFSAAAISSLLIPVPDGAAALAEAGALDGAAALAEAGALDGAAALAEAGVLAEAGALDGAAALAALDAAGDVGADVPGATVPVELLQPTTIAATIAAITPRRDARLITWPYLLVVRSTPNRLDPGDGCCSRGGAPPAFRCDPSGMVV